MNKTLRKLTFLLCVVALLVSTLVLSAGADTKNTATADGVTVSLEIPKDSYAQNEELEAIVSVQNFSVYNLNKVRAEIFLPEGLHLVTGSTAKTYSVISAGSVSTNTIKATADPVAPGSDMTLWLVIGGAGVAVVAAAVGVYFFLKGKKIAKAAMIFLAVALALTLLPQPAKAADGEVKVELSETVNVGGKDYTVTAVITYTLNTAFAASSIDVDHVAREDLTRADLEKALEEIAWDYYLKGGYYQYDSTELTTRGDVGSQNPLAKDYGGTWRTNTFSTMEDGTADAIIYSVCSDFCWNVYNEALEFPVLGNRINSVTIGLFRLVEQWGDGSAMVMRWYDAGVSQVKAANWAGLYGNTTKPDVTAEEAVEFFRNWEETMRPGDILVARSNGGHQHAMLYVGNGKILHCGGGKFDLESYVDKTEPDGAIGYVSVDGTFIDGTDQKGYFRIDGTIADENTNGAWLIVVRPLNLLTIDDGDGDPSNDKLDLDYVLDIGVLESQLANNENHPTKTSDYGIPDATWTRMEYPGMNIDRTVNISLHRSATKGDRLTYRVTITNNSNNANYSAYRSIGSDTFYMGQAYIDLPISETVPEYTKLVSVSKGGAVDENGVIHWNINVPAGETVTVSYTVEVTGNQGDRIVNAGGYVGGIPSNSITTIIGGQKLNNVAQVKMQNFFTAGTSVWNSNDGYKITADPAKETEFVERIYEELVGVKLELPGIEEIMNIFFTQGKLYQPHGLHIAHDTPLTRYMFTLNDREEVAEEYQYVWDMLVEGYYGGVWVYSNDYNDEARMTELRTDYLEPGDILVYIRLRDSVSGGQEYEERPITGWELLVYLGNGRFASLNSSGKLRAVSGTQAIYPAFGQDLFVALRPTQLYNDIYEDLPSCDGATANLGAEDQMVVYQFDPSTVLLSDEAIKKLQALHPRNFMPYGEEAVNTGYAERIYAALGLDIVTNGTDGATYATIVKACFEDDSNAANNLVDVYEHLYYKAAAPLDGYETLFEMLMYYGGAIYMDSEPLTSVDQLYPGDVLLLGRRTISAYLCAVYTGNGKFLVATQEKENVTAGSQVKDWFVKEILSEAELAEWLNEPVNPEETDAYIYEGYVVIRPSRAFEDINQMIIRDISTGVLTKEEKEIISNLTIDDWLVGKRKQVLPNFPAWVYKQASIDVSNYFTEGGTITKVLNGIFDTSLTHYEPLKKGAANYNAAWADMLVDDLYGGKYFAVKDRKVLNYSDLQIGDIVCATKKNDGSYTSDSKYIYMAALYQGGNQFLVTESPSSGYGKAYISTSGIIGHDMSEEWIYFFVLRPSNLANGMQAPKSAADRDIATGELTSTEKNKIANFTTDKIGELEAFAANVYGNANVDVTMYVDLNVNNTRKELFTDSGLLISGDSKYHKMLVPGYYGGAKNAASAIPTNKTFVPEDFQIGDIFCGFLNNKCSCCDSWEKIIGIYQGNGKFIVSRLGCTNKNGVSTDISGKTTKATSIWGSLEDLNSTYMYYYVLRPQRLAGEHLMDVVLSQTDAKLTIGQELNLTFTAVPESVTVENITWESTNTSVATVDANGKVTAVAEGETYIRLTCDGLTVQCKVKVYARNIEDGRLTAEEQTILAAYTADKAGLWYAFVNPAYEAAGIYVEAFDTTIGFNDLRKAVLATTASDYTKMLVAGYTGGSKMTDSRTFVPADLKVGDIIATATAKCEHGSWTYLTGLYVGDGKFLVSKRTCATEGCSSVYIDEYGVALTNGMTSFWSDAAALKASFEYYFVLRPQQLATRNITSGVLTADEMASIAGYTADNAALWYAFVAPAYNAAGIEVDAFNTNIGFNDLRKAVLGTTASDYTKMLMPGYTGGSKMTESRTFAPADLKIGDIIASSTAKCAHGSWTYLTGLYVGDGKFLVSKRTCTTEGCATVYVDEYGKALTNGMTSYWSDAAALNSAYEYYFVLRPERLAAGAMEGISLNKTEVTLEIGGEETLVATPATGITWTSSNTSVATVDANGKVTAVAAGTATITANCDGYTATCEVTVKADKREITSGALTAEEMAALQNYVPERAGTVSPFMKEAYAAANIDLAPAIGTDSWFTIRGYIYDATGNWIEGTTNFHKMAMPGYFGGVDSGNARTFTPADFKIGDIFAGAHNVGCSESGSAKKWVYITGVYIGNGKFVVSESHPAACTDTCSKTYVDTYGDANSVIWANEDYMKTTYKFYFVLRPERLAADAIQSVSLDKTTASVEVGSNVTLAVAKNPTTAVAAVNTTWTSSNTSVATVDNTGKVTAVAAGTATITVNCDGYIASCEVTVTGTVAERDISSGALTEEEMAILAAYSTGRPSYWYDFVPTAYKSANITIEAVSENLSYNNLRKKLINDDGTLVTTESVYTKMLMPGYYGGKKAPTGRTFTPADFKIGDMFATATAKCENGSWTYLTGLYVGEGKFLVSKRCCATEGCGHVYEDVYGGTLTNGRTSFWSDAAALEAAYEYYFVLRPERLAVVEEAASLDYTELSLAAGISRTLTVVNATGTVTWTSSNNAVATVDENGKVTAVAAGDATITASCDGKEVTCAVKVLGAAREMASGVLTAGEKATISTAGTDIFATYTTGPAISAVYAQAGVDANTVYGATGAGDVFKIIKGTKINANILATYVAGSLYGGESGNGTKTFVPADFEVGDILVANYKCTHNKWPTITAIYQGNGKFLAVRQPGSSGCTCSKEAHFDIYDAAGNHNAAGHVSIWSTAKDTANTEGGAWLNYAVLRPSQLAD